MCPFLFVPRGVGAKNNRTSLLPAPAALPSCHVSGLGVHALHLTRVRSGVGRFKTPSVFSETRLDGLSLITRSRRQR
jgi:hypothetical protein